MDRRKKHLSRGFTLIEMMLVVCIIGILSALAIPRVLRSAAKARRTEMLNMMDKMRLYFINQYRDQGTYFQNGITAAVVSDFNPPNDSWPTPTSTAGTPQPWSPTAVGWNQYSFPPDSSLFLRYQYTVSADGTVLTLTAVGVLQGYGPYEYVEQYTGEVLEANYPVELPDSL